MIRLTGILFLVPLLAVAQEKKETPSSGKRHALLVGVSHYPNLAERLQLAGSANDVLLLKETLTKSCAFKSESIRVLSEAEGAKQPERLPTKANIRREFEHLAKTVREGDQVFISLSGHGSQQPEGAGVTDREPEPDGLDELFLPRDVGKWSNARGSVENAIVDDELGLWLKAIRERKASVVILVDACHSGTVTRGAGDERMRQLNFESDLGIPKEAVRKAEAEGTAREKQNPNPNRLRGFVGEDPPLKLADKDGFVALYAAQACEPTVEIALPTESRDAKPYGILTYSFCRIVTESAAKSKKPLTYREIAQRIHLQYSAWGRTFPTPVIEGGNRDQLLFGTTEQPGRSSIELRKSDEQYTITAGSLHGITPGTILSVSPPPGQGDDLLGYVTVDSIQPSESKVSPVEYEKVKEVENLPVGGICKVVSIDFGDLKRKIGVDPLDDDAKPISKELRQRLMSLVKKLDQPNSLLRAVEMNEKPHWLVRVLPGEKEQPEPKVILVPATGFSRSIPGIQPPAFGPPGQGVSIEKWLTETTRSIAKAENLKAICGRECPSGDEGLDLEIVLKLNGKIVPLPATNLHAFTGDRIEMEVENKSRFPIDLSILYLDSSYGIDSLYPKPKSDEFNRLRINEKCRVRSIAVNPQKASATEGLEHLILFAVEKGTEQPVNFSSLAQARLGRLRGDEIGLERLLAKGCFGEGKTRAVGTSPAEIKYRTSVIPFIIHKEKRPKE